MRSNDDLLSVQGKIYTLVDSEGYLVREDIEGERTRYPLSGGGAEYTAGDGISIEDDQISVDFTKVKSIENKNNIKVGEVVLTGAVDLEFDPNYEVFLNEITLISGKLEINEMQFNDFELDANETSTFESWIKTTNNEDIDTIEIDEDIKLVGEFPDTLSGSFVHVFTRRIYKDNSNNIHEAISYAYSF